MLRKYLYLILITAIFAVGAVAQGTDTVMVLPFENTSSKAEFNWIGESFADSLSDLLRVPALNVISNDERKIIQQRLRIPLTSLPSLATSLKLARESGSTLLVTGKYAIVPAQGDTTATVNVTTKIVRVSEGRFLSEELPDGRRIQRDITLTDALGNLQTMQGQIAYQILYQRDKALPYSQNQLIESATVIPPRAFEAYTKGLLTTAPEARENYFKNALRLYSDAVPDSTYADAALELGHLYLDQKRANEAVDAFERVIFANQQCKEKAKADNKPIRCGDRGYAEASFYIGLLRWQQGNYEQALATLRPLADDLKLTSVYNTLGAIDVQASRAEKKNDARSAALLSEGLDYLKKASDSAPDELNIKFNYALANFLQGNYPEASTALKAMIAARPTDGDSYYLLAKTLSAMNDATATDVDNQARRLLTVGNRYANLEKEWLKSKTVNDIVLRVEQPARKDFVSVILSQRKSAPAAPAMTQTETLLAQARDYYKKGQDDEAMSTIRRLQAGEPMNAESFLILGKIHLRQGNLDQAVSSFKTALFWDNKLIDAHVNLGKIFVEKGDCLQAKNYAASAMDLDANNQDALGLQRQAERCSK
jgi:tetratricopeptide (TPR) repeat protein